MNNPKVKKIYASDNSGEVIELLDYAMNGQHDNIESEFTRLDMLDKKSLCDELKKSNDKRIIKIYGLQSFINTNYKNGSVCFSSSMWWLNLKTALPVFLRDKKYMDNIHKHIDKLNICKADYVEWLIYIKELLNEGKNVFLYLDPPYISVLWE